MPAKKADAASNSLVNRVDAELARIAPQLSQVRRHIHQRPELSGKEFSTTAYVSKRLKAGGVPHEVAPGKRGVVTQIVGAGREAGDTDLANTEHAGNDRVAAPVADPAFWA